jgi:hypothetical protein
VPRESAYSGHTKFGPGLLCLPEPVATWWSSRVNGDSCGVLMTKRLLGLIGVLGLLSGLGVIQASANDDGYQQPPAVVNNCDAGHGAFGAFDHHFASNGGINWISMDAQEDGGLGHDTGPTNSGASQICNAP